MTTEIEYQMRLDIPPRAYRYADLAVIIRCGDARIVLFPKDGLTLEQIEDALARPAQTREATE